MSSKLIRDIEPLFAPALSLGREVKSRSGYIDNVCISPSGHLTIVEAKLWRSPDARRQVIGQTMEYAKAANKWTFDYLDEIVRKNLLLSYRQRKSGCLGREQF